MNRVLVMGPPGAGKSTLARRLGAQLGIDVIHLDSLHFEPGWVEVEPSVEEARLRELVQGERWVIDGNYSRLLDIRLARADTVILLDFLLWLCYWRVTKRWLRYRGRSRPDVPDGCPEKIEWEFLKWIWSWPTHSRPQLVSRLAAVSSDKQVMILRGPRDVALLVGKLSASLNLGDRSGSAGQMSRELTR